MIGFDIILFLNAKGAKFFYNLIENILRFANQRFIDSFKINKCIEIKALRSAKNKHSICHSLESQQF